MTKESLITKLILSVIALFLSVAAVSGQSAAAKTPQELLSAIQKSKPDTNRVSLQLALGSYYLLKTGEDKKDLDSAIVYLNQALDLSTKLHDVVWQNSVLVMIGAWYKESGDMERCKQTYMRVISSYHSIGDKYHEAQAWRWLGDMYDDYAPTKERMGFYQQARSIYLQNHDQLNAALMLSKIAEFHIDNKQLKLAETELLEALVQFKAYGYKGQGWYYNKLYYIEYTMGNYYRAMRYASEGIKVMKFDPEKNLLGGFYMGLASCNYVVGKFNESLEWIRKVIADDKGALISDHQCLLAQVLTGLHRTKEARAVINEIVRKIPPQDMFQAIAQYQAFAHYYAEINNNDRALFYYKKILEPNVKRAVSKPYFDEVSLVSNNEIAHIYLKTNQAKKAGAYLENSTVTIKNAERPMSPNRLLSYYRYLFKYNCAIGNYRIAVKNSEQLKSIEDSLFTADKDKQIAELNIQYETAQREQSIKDLHSQSAVQQARLDKANLQRNITIGGGFVLFIIAGVVYNGYRHKQLSNLKLRASQQQINSQNIALQRLVNEKEWLLKEVHHRVKNNLHTVICLLESQAAYLEDDALKAIENGQHRIYAMSLIYQKLYQSDDIKTIDMAEYIPELVQSLEDSFDASDHIEFKLNIDPVKLDISYAIPLGLIINEAITNCIKYAFPDNRNGEISISMIDMGARVKLELADNGIGMPEIEDEGESGSLGLVLMKGLSEDIDADIKFEVKNGTKITITFDPNALNSADSHIKLPHTKEMYV